MSAGASEVCRPRFLSACPKIWSKIALNFVCFLNISRINPLKTAKSQLGFQLLSAELCFHNRHDFEQFWRVPKIRSPRKKPVWKKKQESVGLQQVPLPPGIPNLPLPLPGIPIIEDDSKMKIKNPRNSATILQQKVE